MKINGLIDRLIVYIHITHSVMQWSLLGLVQLENCSASHYHEVCKSNFMKIINCLGNYASS